MTDLTDGGVRCERLEDRNNGGGEYSSISKRSIPRTSVLIQIYMMYMA